MSVSATANPGYTFTGFTGDLSGTTNPQNLTVNAPKSVTANFTATVQHIITTSPAGLSLTVDGAPCTAPCTFQWTPGTNHTIATTLGQPPYYFAYWNDGGALAHSVTAQSAPTTYTASFFNDALLALRQCLGSSTSSTCTLAAGTHTVTETVQINRSNVVVQGATTRMNDTKLLRDSSFTDDLIRIGEQASVSGVVIRYLTVCGGSDIAPDWGTPGSNPKCPPRVTTTCGERTKDLTLRPGQPDPPAPCTDIRVVRSGLPTPRPNPFTNPPPSYAVEFDNVDLEDATGHALSLYGAIGSHVDDIYFHHGQINYSGVTGILIGVGGVSYTRKVCDAYPDQQFGFANHINVFAPRNIRVENSTFTENRTGVMGGIGRWVAFQNNPTVTGNYVWPQAQGCANPDDCWGGTLEFDVCADQIRIANNHFTGPGAAHPNTQALELYGRNITVDTNTISGYVFQGIVAHSTHGASIQNNTITFAAPSLPEDGGITVTTVGAGGACTDAPLEIYRESKNTTISGNTISGQHYGVNLTEHPWRSTGAIHNLTIGTNYGNWSTADYWQAPFVWANAYNGYTGPSTTLGPQLSGFRITPRALPVDAEGDGGFSRALCQLPGAARALLTFAVSDDSNGSANLPGLYPRIDYGAPGYAGALQIRFFEGIFSNTGPPGGPALNAQDCRFYFDADYNTVYLDDGTGTWHNGEWWSVVGPGGRDLTYPNVCTIHAASSSATGVAPGQYARSVALDVEFLGPSAKKHIYVYTLNKNGIPSYAPGDPPVIWQYWGWWQKP